MRKKSVENKKRGKNFKNSGGKNLEKICVEKTRINDLER